MINPIFLIYMEIYVIDKKGEIRSWDVKDYKNRWEPRVASSKGFAFLQGRKIFAQNNFQHKKNQTLTILYGRLTSGEEQ